MTIMAKGRKEATNKVDMSLGEYRESREFVIVIRSAVCMYF